VLAVLLLTVWLTGAIRVFSRTRGVAVVIAAMLLLLLSTALAALVGLLSALATMLAALLLLAAVLATLLATLLAFLGGCLLIVRLITHGDFTLVIYGDASLLRRSHCRSCAATERRGRRCLVG
jgi:hypothetical protein